SINLFKKGLLHYHADVRCRSPLLLNPMKGKIVIVCSLLVLLTVGSAQANYFLCQMQYLDNDCSEAPVTYYYTYEEDGDVCQQHGNGVCSDVTSSGEGEIQSTKRICTT